MKFGNDELYDYQDVSVLLIERAIALREKSYTGCGFHYGMMSRAAACVRTFHNLDEFPFHDSRRLRIKILMVEVLAHDITKAEVSASKAEHNG